MVVTDDLRMIDLTTDLFDKEPECVEEGCEKPCDVIAADQWTDNIKS